MMSSGIQGWEDLKLILNQNNGCKFSITVRVNDFFCLKLILNQNNGCKRSGPPDISLAPIPEINSESE